MKRKLIWLLLLTIAWPAYSQSVTLEPRVARAAYNDLLEGDAAKEQVTVLKAEIANHRNKDIYQDSLDRVNNRTILLLQASQQDHKKVLAARDNTILVKDKKLRNLKFWNRFLTCWAIISPLATAGYILSR